eukprot:m.161606 g.161606  ORF g.161606 m.161606 type:complete len:381 (-) comp16378_c1_seq2:150-1292(-)
MTRAFRPGTLTCLDESMCQWTNEYAPANMHVPRKPTPDGNEYHSIACVESGIMFQIKLQEGRHRPPEEHLPFPRLSSTARLILTLTQPWWGRGMRVVMDSGFSTVQGLVELERKGVHAVICVKRRKYWPRGIPGDSFKAAVEHRPAGSTLAKKATFVDSHGDNTNFYVAVLREARFAMLLMATCFTTVTLEDSRAIRHRRLTDGTPVHFELPDVFHVYYRARHAVDDHNKLRVAFTSIEQKVLTKSWALRQLQFVLAITEVNAYLAFKRWVQPQVQLKMRDFRRLLARQLLDNPWLQEEGLRPKRSKTSPCVEHEHRTTPAYSTWDGSQFVIDPKHNKTRVRQRKCRDCSKRTIHYCSCSPGHGLCSKHYVVHVTSLSEE